MSKSSKSSTHYLSDTIGFDVSSKGPSSGMSVSKICVTKKFEQKNANNEILHANMNHFVFVEFT